MVKRRKNYNSVLPRQLSRKVYRYDTTFNSGYSDLSRSFEQIDWYSNQYSEQPLNVLGPYTKRMNALNRLVKMKKGE